MTAPPSSTDPDDPFNAPPPSEEEQLTNLVRELQMAEGFALIFAVCNRAEDRDRLITAVQERSTGKRIQEVPVREEIPHLLHHLRRVLDSPAPDAVFVYGMENWISGAADPRSSPFILNLNAARNHFGVEVKCPMVLWMPEFLLGMIAQGAPDFASVRSGVHVFHYDVDHYHRTLRTLSSIGMLDIIGTPHKEKLNKITELYDILTSYRELPPYQKDRRAEERLSVLLGDYLTAAGDYSEAIGVYEHLLHQWSFQDEINVLELASALNNLGYLYKRVGSLEKADHLYRQSLTISERIHGNNHPEVAHILNNYGELQVEKGNIHHGETLFLRALDIYSNHQNDQHNSIAIVLDNLASIRADQGKTKEALSLLQRALDTRLASLGERHPETAASFNNIATALIESGRFAEALPLLERSEAILTESLGPKHPHTEGVQNNIRYLRESMENRN